MKTSIMMVGLLTAISFVRAAGAAGTQASTRVMSFTITKQNIVGIEPGKDKAPESFAYLVKQNLLSVEPGKDPIRQAFDYDGGQFEVLIPKKLFPVPAPNCRKNIILRMPGTDKEAPGSKEKLESRWQLFQSLHAVKEGKIASVEVPIEVKHSPGIAPYMRLDKQGNPTLEWCNAYINANAMGTKPLMPAP